MSKVISNSRSTAIIGMDKNVGKTTVLNYILSKTKGSDVLGLTSIGRDGESVDRVTHTPKPKIYVKKDTILATAKICMFQSDITKEILESTGINTPMGNIVFIRSKSDGYIDLAGPSTTSQMKEIVSKLKEYKADQIYVDGAISRMTQCSPAIVDSAVLCTGAVLGNNIKTVVEKTAHVVKMLSLPRHELSDDLGKLELLPSHRVVIIANDQSKVFLEAQTSTEVAEKIDSFLDDKVETIYIKGVLSEDLSKKLLSKKHKNKAIDVVVEDGTKIFIGVDVYNQMKRHSINIYVQYPINLKELYYNPTSPTGASLDDEDLRKALQESTGLNAINVFGRDSYV